ncbi:MAG: folate-binding protein YgfZ [Methylophagaceae bacterium]|jgi:folate-binding protein YgfZ
MTPFWQTLIQDANTDNSFTSLESTPCFMALDDLGSLSISGDDSHAFLQNLLTNDITLLAIGQSQYSGLCNPKGRLLALFLIIRTAETNYQLIMPKALCGPIAKRLGMYILRSKVKLSNDSEKMVCLGLTQSSTLGPELALGDSLEAENYYTTKLPSSAASGRWLVMCQSEVVVELAETLVRQGYQNQHADYWQWLDITSGLASIFPSTQEKFTPQQLNLDLTEVVNFKKGCYPGQEVVARLYYLGKPNRRLFVAKANSALFIDAGDELMTSQGSVAGHFVSTLQHQNTVWCLVSLKLKERENVLVLPDGQTMTLTSDLMT